MLWSEFLTQRLDNLNIIAINQPKPSDLKIET